MALIIPNFTMPDCCENCPCCERNRCKASPYYWDDDTWWLEEEEREKLPIDIPYDGTEYKQRMEWCPLKEVPDAEKDKPAQGAGV